MSMHQTHGEGIAQTLQDQEHGEGVDLAGATWLVCAARQECTAAQPPWLSADSRRSLHLLHTFHLEPVMAIVNHTRFFCLHWTETRNIAIISSQEASNDELVFAHLVQPGSG